MTAHIARSQLQNSGGTVRARVTVVALAVVVAIVAAGCAGTQKQPENSRAHAGTPTPSDSAQSPSLSPMRPIIETSQGPEQSAAPKPAPAAAPSPSAPAASPASPSQAPPPPGLVTIFPSVRVDRAAGVVEFDATVPIDPRDPNTPTIFLEVIACPRDTKEHETLLVTSAKPSHIHAALLLIGLEPGAPGRVEWKDKAPVRIPPRGPEVDITFRYRDQNGASHEARPADWIKDGQTDRPMPGRTGESTAAPRWVFAGSLMRNAMTESGVRMPRYEADADGTLIGFATFGSELLAYAEVISHESSVDAPVWIADAKTIPQVGTSVVVVLRARGAGVSPAPR